MKRRRGAWEAESKSWAELGTEVGLPITKVPGYGSVFEHVSIVRSKLIRLDHLEQDWPSMRHYGPRWRESFLPHDGNRNQTYIQEVQKTNFLF